MQGPAPIPVFRPSYLSDGLEFQGHLVESPANVFYQSVKASRASIDKSSGAGRMQFQWRSVSDNLLMSPTVMLRFQLKITSPVVWNQVIQHIAVRGVRGPGGATQTLAYSEANAEAKTAGPPAICFADGDAFTSCCSAINLNFNGTSLSLNRTNYFWRDYMRTQISSDDAARIYKSAGGSYDKNDGLAVCVPNYGTADLADGAIIAGAALGAAHGLWRNACQAGLTMDSGIQERCKTLYALLTSEGAQITGGARYLQVSYPVPVAPFNPWRGYSVPATSPYKSTPLAIPHLSAGGLDFLIEDFQKTFLRRMGMNVPTADDNMTGAAVAESAGPYVEVGFTNGSNSADLGIEFVADSAEIELKYFRLSHTRSLKESYRFNVWQAQTFLGPLPPNPAVGGTKIDGHLRDGADNKGRMVCIGKDPCTSAAVGGSMISYDETNNTWKCKFTTINLAQVPSFLLISAPRLNDEYLLGGATSYDVSKYTAAQAIRNKSANLYIKSIKLQVNNAQGHIDKVGSTNEAFILAERLFEMTRENAGSHYFKEGGFRVWRDTNMAVLLSSSQFAPGLGVSDGVAYPVNIDITLELQNRNTAVSALALQGAKVHQIIGDKIRAQAQATAIFTKIILSTTETSATTNAMNFALDSAERLLNQAGSQR
jgi:hypothetical protein